MSNEVAMMRVDPRVALEPRDRSEAWALAKVAVESGFFAVKNPAEALVILMTGRELGLTAMQSLRGIYIVKGRPMVSADAMVACVMADPRCELWQPVESTDQRCVIRTKRRGMSEPVTGTFTMDDAKAAQLTGSDMYRKYPRVMLRHRCAAELVREVYPDIILGIFCEGEIPGEDPRGFVSLAREASSEPPAEPARELPATTNAPVLDATPAPADKIPALHTMGVESAKPSRKSEPPAQETAPADVPVTESEVLAAFKERAALIELPGESVAVWLKNRALVAKIPPEERKAAWGVLVAKTREVGRMKDANAAETWLKRAIKAEDDRNNPPPDDPPTGTDGPARPSAANDTSATSAPVAPCATPASAPQALDVVDAPGARSDGGDDLSTRAARRKHLGTKHHERAVLASYAAHSGLPHYLDDCTARLTEIEARDGTRLSELTARKRLVDARNKSLTKPAQSAMEKAA